MLFVGRCVICSRPGESPCTTCRAAFEGAPIALAVPGAASAIARYPYDGELRRALLALKYANARATAGYFARELAGLLDRAQPPPVLVSWVPTSPARRRERGFDQAEIIARRLGRELGLPVRALLRRRPGPAQTGRSRLERRVGPAFEPLVPVRVPLLLIDDVATTLATATTAVASLPGCAIHVRTVAATVKRAQPGRGLPGNRPERC